MKCVSHWTVLFCYSSVAT